MKKVLFILILLSLFVCVGCEMSNPLDNVVFNDAIFDYDLEEHSIFVSNLPNEYTVTYVNNDQTELGTYTVKAYIYFNRELRALLKANMTIAINKDELALVSFDNQNFEYDGKAHSLTIDNLPEGFSVTYSGNNKTDVGVYTVSATIYKDSVAKKTIYAVMSISEVGSIFYSSDFIE